MKMTYQVTSPIRHDGIDYAFGDQIDLNKKHAAELIEANAIDSNSGELVGGDQARQDSIVAAINQLDKDNAEFWQKDGKPRVDAVAAIVGSTVTAIERNNAWAIINAVA